MNTVNVQTEITPEDSPRLGRNITLVFKSGAVVKLNNVSIGEQSSSNLPPIAAKEPMASGLLIQQAVSGDQPNNIPLLYCFDAAGKYRITEKIGNDNQGPVYKTTYYTPNTLLDALIFE